MTKKRRESLRLRLDKFITKDNATECYGWSGAVCTSGFPRIYYNGTSMGAHRVAWMAHFGKIPQRHYVHHTCNHKTCTNPSHLFLSTIRARPSVKGAKIKSKEQTNARPHRQRLSVDLPTRHINGIKKNANKRNVTITKYMCILVAKALEIEKSYEKKG